MYYNFLKPRKNLIVLSIIIYILNVLLILQLIPVFESQTIDSKIVNLIVFPPNFIFEDLFGVSSVRSIDIFTWIIQLFYDYLIAGIIIKAIKML